MPSNLAPVSFRNPPVQEVVFSLQFRDPVGTIELLAAAAAAFVEDFPVRQVQPPLPRMTEPEDALGAPEFTFGLTPILPLPRYWLVSRDGHRLLQVQEDRLAFNWRALGREVEYPRYATLRGEFEKHARVFSGLAAELGATTPDVDLCELSYVNELVDLDADQRPPLAHFVATQNDPSFTFLPHPEETSWQSRWRIDDGNDPSQFRGRLHVSAQPVRRALDEREIFLLTMSTRLPTQPVDVNRAFDMLDIGHDWIVRGFADLTTETMHKQWEREG